ncbi:hypothetical protein LI291_16695, partial [Intestinibacillus massiliensis]|nr:hypothetical protein [Intestinibacillus massiliensis]
DGITIFAVDLDTGKISGSTDKQLLNKKAADLGLDVSAPELGKERQSGKVTFGGKDNYCVMEATDNVLVCVSGTHEKIYENVPSNMALIIFSLALLAIVVIFLLLRILDNMIINGIYGIIAGTKKIAAGDLDYR